MHPIEIKCHSFTHLFIHSFIHSFMHTCMHYLFTHDSLPLIRVSTQLSQEDKHEQKHRRNTIKASLQLNLPLSCLGGVLGVGISSTGLPYPKGGFEPSSNLGGASNILSDLMRGTPGPIGIGLASECISCSIGGPLKSSLSCLMWGSFASNLGPSSLVTGPLRGILGCSSNLGSIGLPGPASGGPSMSIAAPA